MNSHHILIHLSDCKSLPANKILIYEMIFIISDLLHAVDDSSGNKIYGPNGSSLVINYAS